MKVKVNILTGFFGSGKTTLISNLVKNDKIKKRIAIIQNEFSSGMYIYINNIIKQYEIKKNFKEKNITLSNNMIY